MWETWVQSLGWEDPLEKGTATHTSILASLHPATPREAKPRQKIYAKASQEPQLSSQVTVTCVSYHGCSDPLSPR